MPRSRSRSRFHAFVPAPGRRALGAVLVFATVVAAASTLGPVRGTAASQLDIVAVQHDPRGEIIASLRPAAAGSTITQVSALVDGAPRPAQLISRPPAAAAVVIAIDTSTSMAGTPLANAQQAAIALADRLDPRDQVAVVTFSDQPTLLSPFSTDRAQTDAQLRGLVASGNTALYDTVAMSADLLQAASAPERVLVLLTDGQDFGSVLPDGRSASLERIAASGAQVQSFALGSDADTTYLAQIANGTHGGFSAVAGDSSLNELFTRLGERLSAAVEVAVQVPPLTRGDHMLQIRAQVDGQTAIATHDVAVTNDGVLTAHLRASSGADDGTLVLDLASVVPADALTLHASVGSTPLPVLDQPARVLIDPWRFPAGPVDVSVAASIAGTVVSTGAFTVTVPALPPRLAVSVGSGADAGAATITGRVQGDPAGAQIVASVDGVEIARGPLPSLRVAAPQGGRLEVTVVDAAGRTLARTGTTLPAITTAAVAGTNGVQWPPLLAAALAAFALGGAGFRVRRVRRARDQRRREWQPSARTLMVGRRPPSSQAAAALGTLVVRPLAGGAEQRYRVGRKPLSLGRSPQCDIVIDDESVGPVHARLYALGGGDFRVHGIAPEQSLPCDGQRADEWMVVRQGEQIAIGSHMLTLLPVEASVA